MLKVLIACLSFALATPAASAPSELIRRHDFESDDPDSLPTGWSSRRSLRDGYRIATSREAAHGGRQGLVLEMAKDPPTWNSVGAVSARADARPYRGRRVRLSAWGRFHQTASNDGKGRFALRIQLVGGGTGDYQTSDDRPVATTDWKQVVRVASVDADADTIVCTALVGGHGRFDVDDVELTALGPVGEGDQPARAISDRGIENLIAFGRLASIVRFFNPADEAAALDWSAFMIDHVDAIERAPSGTALATALRGAFAPIAPTVRIGLQPMPPSVSRAALVPAGVTATARAGWLHHGFGGSAVQSIYRSERLSRPLEGGADLLPLGAAWSGPLGGGVHAQVPLILAKSGDNTLPRPKAAVRRRDPARPEGWMPSSGDRATRLAAVLLASGVLDHFYPYADVVGLDMPAAVGEALRSAAMAAPTEFQPTLERLSARLHDGHGFVYGPRQPSKWLPLAFEFVGNDLAVVASRDSAGRAHAGDVVTAMDGRPIDVVLADWRTRLSASTEGHLRSRISQSVMMSDTARRLTLRAPDGATREARFTTGTSDLPQIARPDSIAELKPGVFYVDLNRITDADWKREVDRLAKGKGIVFDLRGYPSRVSALPITHLAADTIWSARWNVPVLRRPFLADAEWDTSGRWPVAPQPPHLDGPVAFLVDGRAVSYAETWMGIIEAYHLGTIVGEPTAGTNGNVCSIGLPGGYTMMYTGMKVLKHDGSRHHGVGIHPAVPVSRTLAALAAGRDEALERALEVVTGRP